MCIVLTSHQTNSKHGDTATLRKENLHLQLSLLTAGFQWAELSRLQAESEAEPHGNTSYLVGRVLEYLSG